MTKKMIGSADKPLICTPLVGVSEEKLLAELMQVLEKQPDALEWRADFFGAIAAPAAVVAMAKQLKAGAGELPLVFTIRSVREGGNPIPLDEAAVLALCAAICEQTAVEYVDCELSQSPAHIACLRQAADRHGTKLIGSFHDFQRTPTVAELVGKLEAAQHYGFDVAKVAVMPQSLEDVLTLLQATLAAKARVDIPLITMSMGKFGVVSRLVGGVFGSALGFAVGSSASAPGQVPVEDFRAVLEIIDRAMGGNGK